MSKLTNNILEAWMILDPLRSTILKACQHIEAASKAANRGNRLSIDYAQVDGKLATSISLLASARAICITKGNLSDPAFDDGDTWDWDDEIGLPDYADLGAGEGGAS